MSDAIIAAMLNDGRLRVDVATGTVFSPRSNTPGKPLGALTKKGYLRTCLHVEGKSIFVMIHRVVCIAAHGLPEGDSRHVNHISGRLKGAIDGTHGLDGAEEMALLSDAVTEIERLREALRLHQGDVHIPDDMGGYIVLDDAAQEMADAVNISADHGETERLARYLKDNGAALAELVAGDGCDGFLLESKETGE